jgi:hypothetical protein
MNFMVLEEGITASIIPILTLIEHKPECIVGCILLGQDHDGNIPEWFGDATFADDPAAELLEYAAIWDGL